MANIDINYQSHPYYEAEPNNCPCDDGDAGGELPASSVAIDNGIASELGVDIACLTDIDPNLTLAFGWRNLAMAIGRSLITQIGYLLDVTGDTEAADYGEDVRAKLNAGLTDRDVDLLAGRITMQALRDERVKSADVAVEFVFSTSSLTATIAVETSEGPFTLVMNISALTVEILDGTGTVVASA